MSIRKRFYKQNPKSKSGYNPLQAPYDGIAGLGNEYAEYLEKRLYAITKIIEDELREACINADKATMFIRDTREYTEAKIVLKPTIIKFLKDKIERIEV